MKASVLIASKTSCIQDVDMPMMTEDDVLVQVKACGVCRSELTPWSTFQCNDNPLGILGHEPSGIIADIGSGVTGLHKDQPVTVFTGRSGKYTEYTAGGFAEYVVVPRENVVPIPATMPFTYALGEPLACLVSAFNRIPITFSDRVALIGCGFMGLCLLQLLKLRCPRELVAIDLNRDALDLALRFGADRVCTPEQLPPLDQNTQAWLDPDHGFDVVIEVTGAQPALTLAGEIVRPHGTIAIVGAHGMRQVDVGQWNIKGLTVINAHEKRRAYFMKCMRNGIDLIARGVLDMQPLISNTYSLAKVDRAYEDLLAKQPGHIKGVVLF